MKKLLKKSLDKSGMSLAEMMVVVAILCILFFVGTISVTKYQRSMKQLELDGFAKEIFMAAQNEISLAKSQKYLGLTEAGEVESAETGISYFLVNESNRSSLSDESSILSLILPFGSIEDTVRLQGNYVIRYHKDSGTILDVFYASQKAEDQKFGHDFSGEGDYELLIGEYKTDRENGTSYQGLFSDKNAVVGYYGGAVPGAVNLSLVLREPSLEIENGDRLSAIIHYPSSEGYYKIDDDVSLWLYVEGMTSGAQKTILVHEASAVSSETAYTIILDDVQSTQNHFAQIFKTADNDAFFLPGENLRIKAIARRKDDKKESEAESAFMTVNSLYASADVTEGPVTITNAGISSFRHLENLNAAVSAVGAPVSSANQLTDLRWGNFASSPITGSSGAALSGEGLYVPVDCEGLSYHGKNHTISGVVIDTNGDAGLFGTFSGNGKIEDLRLEDFKVTSSAGNAGALCGTLVDSALQNVIAYNNTRTVADDSVFVITGKENAGGLIGKTENAEISGGAAALYVVSTSGNAGGLIGESEASQVTYSFSGGHTSQARYGYDPEKLTERGHLNVIAPLSAGGLLGSASGTTVSYSYSTCSALNNQAGGSAAGLVGTMEGGSVSHSYATGKLISSAGETVYPFINSSSTDCSGGHNFYLKNMSANAGTDPSGVTGVSKEEHVTEFILENPSEVAYTYDDTLTIDYRGLFSFPTISQLAGGSLGESYSNVLKHYGDWQIPSLEELDYEIRNEDRLYLSIDMEKLADIDNFTLYLTGATSGTNLVLLVDTGTKTVSKIGYLTSGNLNWVESSTVTARFNQQLSMDESGKYLFFTLDDVTEPGAHFGTLFADDTFAGIYAVPGEGGVPTVPETGAKFILGEDLAIALIKNEADAAALQSDAVKDSTTSVNSLFAYVDSEHNAGIRYIRHLENLDPAISGVVNTVVGATILNDITWDGVFYDKIYSLESTQLASEAFSPIHNTNLDSLEGSTCTLTGFPIGGTDAGLFSLIDAEMAIANLRLMDFSVSGTGNAGALAATVTAPVTVESVLAMSENHAVSAGAHAGGLIGSLTASKASFNNSAASVLVSGGGSAGGLVGYLSCDDAEFSQCYAGGHTTHNTASDEVYYSTAAYNVTGGSAAGGLIGTAVGEVTLTETFNAASVSAGSNPAGGLIGQVSGDIFLDTVYSVAPVENTTISATEAGAAMGSTGYTGSGYAGALFGVNGGTIQNGTIAGEGSAYYLPEVFDYYESDGTMTVETIGSGADMTEEAKLAYYELDSDENMISAKIHNDAMQIKTYPYDSLLLISSLGSNREYPFAIWTKFKFDGDYNRGTYYGDWQPVLSRATVLHTVTFRYEDPYKTVETGHTVVKDCMDADLKVQTVQEGRENSLLTPYLDSYAGYQVEYWRIYDNQADSSDRTKGTELSCTDGVLTIPKDCCDKNTYVTAFYTRNADVYVAFFYDETGANENFIQMGSSLRITSGTPMADIPQPTRIVKDYIFEGWYKDPGFTNKVDFTTGTITTGLNVYAKYIPTEYYTITVDFVYQQAGSKPEQLKNIPQYSVEGVSQYRIRRVIGTPFTGEISLPVQKDADSVIRTDTDVTVTASASLNTDKRSLHLEANGDASFVVVYDDTPQNTVKYRILYRKYNTNNDGSFSENASAYYDYNPYGTRTFEAPAGTVPDILPDGVPVEGFTVGDVHYKELKSYSNEEEQIENNVIIVDYHRNSYVLSYETNLGMTTGFLRPKTIMFGQSIASFEPKGDDQLPTKKGYILDTENEARNHGWTIIKSSEAYSDTDSVSEYYWDGTMPAEDITAYAKWAPGTAKYYVLFWKQNVNDDKSFTDSQKTYDYAGYQEYSGKTGSTAKLTTAQTGMSNSGNYIGFKYNSANSDTDGKPIEANGTTVLNVYYDRNVITYTFYARSKTINTLLTNLGYRFDSGPTATLCYNGFYTKNGDSYTSGSSSGTNHYVMSRKISGLYGQPLSKYGYQWPALVADSTNYRWKFITPNSSPGSAAGTLGDSQSYLGEFVLSPKTSTSAIFIDDSSAAAEVLFYLENEDGNYQYDAKGVTSLGTFYIRDKYEGYTAYKYLKYSGYPANTISKNLSSSWHDVATESTTTIYESYPHLVIVFTRKTFSLQFKNVTDNEFYTSWEKNVKFGTNLTGYRPTGTPTTRYASQGYVWDGKYYKDENCTEEFDFNIEMPTNAVIVYVKFVLKDRTLTFDLNDPDASDGNPPSMAAGMTYALTNNKMDVADVIADAAGHLKADYTPAKAQVEGKKKYAFSGWYLDREGTDPFIYSMDLLADTTVYAKWTEIREETGTLTVYYQRPRTESDPASAGDFIDLKTPLEVEYQENPESEPTKDIPVDTKITLKAADIEGYYPENMQQEVVIASGTNTRTFYYRKIEPWSYQVQYAVSYSSFGDLADLDSRPAGLTLSAAKEIPVGTSWTADADNQYETVVFEELPAGFEDYRLIGYRFNDGALVKDSVALISNEKATNVLTFILAPDPTTVGVKDRYSVYNGEAQSVRDSGAGTIQAVTAPAGYTGQIEHIYRYYDSAGHLIEANKIVNAGVYAMNEYVILKLTKTSASAENLTYLLGKDSSKSLNLRIGPRPITATSGTMKREHIANKPLVYNYVDVVGPGDGKGYSGTSGTVDPAHPENEVRKYTDAFIGDDWKRVSFAFSVEAFRLDMGKSANSFTYVFKKLDTDPAGYDLNQLKKNYSITTVFGDLVIPWKYSVSYKAEYQSLGLTEAELTESGITPLGQMEVTLKQEQVEADTKNVSYTFGKPAGFEGYTLKSCLLNNKAATVRDDSTVAVSYNEKGDTKLIFTLSPDFSTELLTDRTVTYKAGETQAVRDAAEQKVLTTGVPAGYTGTLNRIYRYYDASGNLTDASAIEGPGTYSVNAYLVLTLSENKEGGKDYSFVLKKVTDKSLKLVIE